MYLVTFISLLAVLFTYLSQYRSNRHLFELAFIIITILGCIHYNFGTDYDNYYDMFFMLSNYYSVSDVFSPDTDINIELGWAFLNIVFSKLGRPEGFFILVAILNIIQNYIYYIFIKRFVPPTYRWFAMAIYLFSPAFYILNFSMMRQGLAVSIVVVALMQLIDEKYIKSLLVILLASTIHTSSLIFLPILFIRLKDLFKNRKTLILILWLLVVVMFAFASFTDSIFGYMVAMDSFADYANYEGVGSKASIGMGFVLNLLPYLVITYFLLNRETKLTRALLLMAIIMFGHLILTPFTLNITLVGRLLYYFLVCSIVVIPNFYLNINNIILKYGITSIYIFMLFYGYSDFFNPLNWAYEDYKTFKTIFSAF